ncbi:MAG: hypothetical protein DWQ01_05020 [Planctomycetota bacterium]|nr:MAG: hypothetical protein DWQ01_05020 [Planctomycetota bacterium]
MRWPDQEFLQAMGWVLLHSFWQLLCIAGILKVALWVVPERKARLRYGLGCVALLLAFTTPWISWRYFLDHGTGNVFGLMQASVSQPVFPSNPDAFELGSVDDSVGSDAIGAARLNTPAPSRRSRWQAWLNPWLPWLAGIWICGALLMSLRPWLGWWTVRKLKASATEPVPHSLQLMVSGLAKRLGLPRPVPVFASAKATVPMVLGIWRPVILIPVSALTGFPPREIESILCHELAHLRRWDPVVNLMQSFLEALFFHHPAVWWMSRMVREERERCCDDMVVAVTEDRLPYLRALERLERRRQGLPWAVAAADGGSLVRRIRRLSGQDRSFRQPWPVSTWAAFLVMAVMAGLMIAPKATATAGAADPVEIRQDSKVWNLEEARAMNQKAYRQVHSTWRERYPGKWMIIVNGIQGGPFTSFEEAVKAADLLDAKVGHRFIFRPGVDDQTESFSYSPWITGKPNWFQFGRRFLRQQKMTIAMAPAVWIRNGKRLDTPDAKAGFHLSAPGLEQKETRRAVASGLFEGDLTITEAEQKSLQLQRFSIPGQVRSLTYSVDCSRVSARVRIDELGIDQRVTAVVMPASVVAKDPPSLKGHPGGLFGDLELQTPDSPPSEHPYEVQGRVLDSAGRPVQGAIIRAFTGVGTLRNSGEVQTDADGRYRLKFSAAMRGPGIQAATISVIKSGFAELNLGMAGDCLIADELPQEDTPWGSLEQIRSRLILPKKAQRIDFVLVPSVSLQGVLLDEKGRLLPIRPVSITGDSLPPSSSVLDTDIADAFGTFELSGVPVHWKGRFKARIAPGQPEWTSEIVSYSQPGTVRLVLVADLTSGENKITVKEWTKDLDLVLSAAASQRVVHTGRKPNPNDERNIQWGKKRKGLQVGLHVPNQQGPYRAGDQIPLEFVLRNVGKEPINFESSPWRQYDNLKIRKEGEGFVDITLNWYASSVEVDRYELLPGEEIVLSSASFGLLQESGKTMEHPVVYQAALEPGRYTAYFRMYFPDVNRFARRKGDWSGGIYSGEIQFEVEE